jgi:hypothetical protein
VGFLCFVPTGRMVPNAFVFAIDVFRDDAIVQERTQTITDPRL